MTATSLTPHAGSLMVLYGAATGRDGIGGVSVLGVRHPGGGRRGEPSVGADRRPVRREAVDRGLARAHRRRAAGGAAGPGRRRAHLRAERVGLASWARRAGGSRGRAAARGVDGGRRDPHQRVAGADARDRPCPNLEEVRAICARWGLAIAVVAELTEGDRLEIRHHGQVVAEVPARSLADEGPGTTGRAPSPSRTASTTRPSRRSKGTWRRRSWRCSPQRTSRASGGPSSSTTSSCRATPWTDRAPTRRSCASRER